MGSARAPVQGPPQYQPRAVRRSRERLRYASLLQARATAQASPASQAAKAGARRNARRWARKRVDTNMMIERSGPRRRLRSREVERAPALAPSPPNDDRLHHVRIIIIGRIGNGRGKRRDICIALSKSCRHRAKGFRVNGGEITLEINHNIKALSGSTRARAA